MTEVEALAADLLDRAQGRGRFVFAIAGPPAAGKSTLAEGLLAALEAQAPGLAALVPMDGYHLDNAVLVARGLLARKGAPMTFDVGGLRRDLARIRAGGEDVLVPVFDRRLDLARAGARVVGAAQPIVLVEGNYLLLDRAPWDALGEFFDRTLLIRVPEAELRRRLIARWHEYEVSAEAAIARAEGNDLPNALTVARDSREPDVVWEDGRLISHR